MKGSVVASISGGKDSAAMSLYLGFDCEVWRPIIAWSEQDVIDRRNFQAASHAWLTRTLPKTTTNDH